MSLHAWPLSGSDRSPIFRRERLYWDRQVGGWWRLDDALVGLALLNLALLPAALLLAPAALLGYALLDEVLGLAVALPAALGISRERRGRTWALLRSTPLSAADIILAKLAALHSLVGEATALLARARWVGTLAAAPLFALMLTTARPQPFPAGASAWTTALLCGAAYLLFIFRPQINTLSGAALGLACSTFARGVSASLVYILLVSGGLSLAGLGLLAGFQHLPLLAGLFSDSVLAGRLALIFTWLFPLAALTLVRALLIPACLALASRRLAGLDD